MESVTVGTKTSAVLIASTNWSWDIGLSLTFRLTSNSSIIRVSVASGNLRVTTTFVFFLAIMFPCVPTLRPSG